MTTGRLFDEDPEGWANGLRLIADLITADLQASRVDIRRDAESWTALRARIAALTRHRPADDKELQSLQRKFRAEQLEAYVVAKLAEAPPLTERQRLRLALIVASWGTKP